MPERGKKPDGNQDREVRSVQISSPVLQRAILSVLNDTIRRMDPRRGCDPLRIDFLTPAEIPPMLKWLLAEHAAVERRGARTRKSDS